MTQHILQGVSYFVGAGFYHHTDSVLRGEVLSVVVPYTNDHFNYNHWDNYIFLWSWVLFLGRRPWVWHMCSSLFTVYGCKWRLIVWYPDCGDPLMLTRAVDLEVLTNTKPYRCLTEGRLHGFPCDTMRAAHVQECEGEMRNVVCILKVNNLSRWTETTVLSSA